MVINSKNKKNSSYINVYDKGVSPVNTATLGLFIVLLLGALFFSSFAYGFSQVINKSQVFSDSLFLKIELYNKNLALSLHEHNAALINEAQTYLEQNGHKQLSNNHFELITYLLYHALESENISQSKTYYTTLRQLPDLSREQNQIVRYWKARMLYEQHNYQATIKILKQDLSGSVLEGFNKPYQIKVLYCMGLSYYHLHEYESAIAYFNQSLSRCNSTHVFYYYVLYQMAVANYGKGNLDAAISCINNYMPQTAVSPKPELDFWQAKLLQLRAFFYREIASNSADSLVLLQKSMTDSERSIPYLNRYLQHQYLESDQLKLNHKYNYFYYKTIEAISQVNNCTPSQQLQFKALHYAELDKNKVLTRYFNKQKAKQTLGMPLDAFTVIDSLYTALQSTKGDFHILSEQTTINKYNKLNYYNNKQQLIQAIHNTENSIKQQYPEYGSMYNTPPRLNTQFIKELSYKQQIMEYVLSDEKVYVFLINNGTIHSYQCKLNQPLLNTIHNFRQYTSNNNALNDNDSSFYNLATSGYTLYQKIIEPLAQHMDTKPLLIIPDNELSLIPFEALLSQPYKGAIEYSALPYLINKFEISYANSLHILQHQLGNTKTQQSNSVLSYLPNYKGLGSSTQKKYIAMRTAFGSLDDLAGARQEVENIKKTTNAILRINQQATENDFINMAHKYSVIHCAMHTLIDHNNPQYSKMLFTPNVDTIEDGFLHSYEINKLRLNCDLLVLSACNTGYGEINRGEGILSLSRAFTKSGSKRILSTLWSIPDKSSVHIIDGFYKGLLQGKTKSESLCQAKRFYLKGNSGIAAHPFFWAGHVISGNNKPVMLNPVKTSRKSILLALFLGFLILLFIGYKQK